MRTTIVSLLVFGSFWGLSGCGSRPVETPSAAAQSYANTAPEQSPAAEVKQVKVPAQSSAPVVKPAEAQAPVVHKETKLEPKEEASDSKPREMKAANDLDRNPFLSSSVKPLLPARTNVTDAAAGFKKQRDFVAALHLSKNLGIPFDQLKTRMTAEHRMSLTDALRDIRSDMTKKDAKAEVKKAEEQAKDDENRAKDQAKVLSASSRK